MNLQSDTQPSQDGNPSLTTRSISIYADQDAWLVAKAAELRRAVSLVIRDIVQEAMDREKRDSAAETGEPKAND